MRREGIDAELTVTYGGALAARSVFSSLEPDNKFALKGLDIKGKVRGKSIILSIRCERGIPSLINTLEDIFTCLGVAEGSLLSLQGIRRSGRPVPRAKIKERRRRGRGGEDMEAKSNG